MQTTIALPSSTGGKHKTLTDHERKLLQLRQEIDPIVEHLKADNRMGHIMSRASMATGSTSVVRSRQQDQIDTTDNCQEEGDLLPRPFFRLSEAAGLQSNWPTVLRELLHVATTPR
jgi:hypothetical protein